MAFSLLFAVHLEEFANSNLYRQIVWSTFGHRYLRQTEKCKQNTTYVSVVLSSVAGQPMAPCFMTKLLVV